MKKSMRVPAAVIHEAVDRSREQMKGESEAHDDNTSNYAVDRAEEGSIDVARIIGAEVKEIVRGGKHNIKDKSRNAQNSSLADDGHNDISRADEYAHIEGSTLGKTPRTKEFIKQSENDEAASLKDKSPIANMQKGSSAKNAINEHERIRYQNKKRHSADSHIVDSCGGTVDFARPASISDNIDINEKLNPSVIPNHNISSSKPVSDTKKSPIKLMNKAARVPKQAAKASIKTVSTVKSIKTAEFVSIKAAQTAKVNARILQMSAQAAARAAHTAAKAIAAASKVAAKVVSVVIKAIAAAIKGIVTAAAAGGWILILIAVLAAVAALLCSAFGVMFSDEADPDKLKEAVTNINAQFMTDMQTQLDDLSSGGYTVVNVIYENDYDGDSFMVNNWADVLAVYAVKVTSGNTNTGEANSGENDNIQADEVLTLTPEKESILKSIFNCMNKLSFRTETESGTAYVEENGRSVIVFTTMLNIYVDVESLDYIEAAELYGFDDNQVELLEELMSPQYYSYFADIISVDVYGGLSPSDLAALVNSLPVGTTGGDIAIAAIECLGTPYSVMDCSDLVKHIYQQKNITLPDTSVEQAKYCYDNGYTIPLAELQPGDLIFWSNTKCHCGRYNEIHHVGIYITDGKIVDASAAYGRVVLRDIWGSDSWNVAMCARPRA